MTQEQLDNYKGLLELEIQSLTDGTKEPTQIEWPDFFPKWMNKKKTREEIIEDAQWLLRFFNRYQVED